MEAIAILAFNSTAYCLLVPCNMDELSFAKGDVLKVLNKDDPNWYKAELNGTEGFVPSNYIQMASHEWYMASISRRAGAELLLLAKSGGKYIQPDGAFLIRASESSPGDFSISVKFQDAVQHFKILHDGAGKYFLWVVKFNSINELIKYHRTVSVSRSQTIYLQDMTQRRATALYDFMPQDDEELMLKKGDEVVILEEQNENWWRGKNMRTLEDGIFPANYVKLTAENLKLVGDPRYDGSYML